MTHINKLGKWIACHITNRLKMIILISIYRLPQLSKLGVYNTLIQYNRTEDKKYRKEVLN